MGGVLVLGGGLSGVRIATGLRDRYDVTLISNRNEFRPSCSIFGILYGSRGYREGTLPLHGLKGVRFKEGEVLKLEPEEMKVITNMGEYTADYIVIALGTKKDVVAVKWFTKVGYNVTDPFESYLAFKALRAINKGKVAVFAPSTPYSCPTLPHSAALISDWLLRKFGKRERFELTLYVGRYERGFEEVYKRLEGIMEERGIEVTEGDVNGVDDVKKELVFDDRRIRFDLLLGVPPQRCPKPILNSGLELRNEWLKVDRSFRTSSPNIFAVGDVASIELEGMEVPKLGVFAKLEADAFVSSMVGERGEPKWRASYFVPTGDGALSVEMDIERGEIEVEGPDTSFFKRLEEDCGSLLFEKE